MNKLPILITFLSSFCILTLSAQQTPKVLIIGMDGCRPDALQMAATPNLDQLIANATYSFDALTEAPTWSGVGWSGMLTGVWKEKHGVYNNSFDGSNYDAYPHFFNHLDACDPNLITASIVHWGPINSQIVDIADYELTVSTDLAVSQEAVSYLSNNDPDVLFLHFDDIDYAGHAHGFSPAISQYTDVIAQTDIYIGEVITALENRPNYANENWLIIVSTDHGGNTSGHGGSSLDERVIFNIFSGDDLPNEQRTVETTTVDMDNVLALNGTDQYIDIPSDDLYDFSSDQNFTIECRVRVNSIDGDPVIVSNKDWISGLNIGYVISFPANGPNWKVNIGDGSSRVDVTGGDISDGKWHHLVVSFDRFGQMKLYQDGSFIGAEDISDIGDIEAGLPFTIGQDGTQAYEDWFDGEIAEVRLWNTVLSEATINAHACATITASHPNYADLIGYWQINAGDGTSILDASPNGNHGTVQGASPNWVANSGDLTCNDYSNTLRIVDVAVTALEYLCGSIDPAWNLDGESVLLQAPLPVELAHFAGKTEDCKVILDWSTASEVNNRHFVVERSQDGNTFVALDDIDGAGTSFTTNHYQFEDTSPLPINYYRLKQIDEDGRINYSKTIVIHHNNCLQELRVVQLFPNPTQGHLTVRFISGSSEKTTVNILDVYGKTILRQTLEPQIGLNDLLIEIDHLAASVYYLQLNNASAATISERFIKY